jgi:hypothetical protein
MSIEHAKGPTRSFRGIGFWPWSGSVLIAEPLQLFVFTQFRTENGYTLFQELRQLQGVAGF